MRCVSITVSSDPHFYKQSPGRCFKMALAGVKLDSDSGGFVSNCFPVRGLLKRDANEEHGAWLVAHRAEQRRRFKAVLCAKPRTYSRIKEERKRTEDHGIQLTTGQFNVEEEEEDGREAVPVLDGYFLMKHCCVEDPADLCSVNIAGLELTDVKEDDFEMFENVAYINAGENYLPFEAFRGFPSLRELEVPFNGLRSLKIEMNSFPCLEVLDLSYNNLCQEDLLTVGQLPGLRVLHLTGNSLKTLPPDMSLPFLIPQGNRKVHRPRFAKLEVLLLDDNNLSDISVFAALAGLPKLRHINMEKNAIYCIPQLKCVNGHVVTQDGSRKRRPRSSRKSGRRPKSRQSGLPGSQESQRCREEGEEDKAGGMEGLEVSGGQPQTSPAATEAADSKTDSGDKSSKKEEDFSLDDLLSEDFSLGDLSERIADLEEEAAKVMEPEPQGTGKDKPLEDYVPKVLPPFPELRYLNLAHNQIHNEDALLAVAAWPMLVHLVIHSNPLTQQNHGDPPLLHRFLSVRLGIRLQRKEEPRLVKPHIEIELIKSRTVNDTVPKVPRSTVEERLQQLALEAPKTAQQPGMDSQPSKSFMLPEDRTLSGLDLETSKRMPLPPIQAPIPPTPPHQADRPRAHAWLEEEMARDDDLERREQEEGGRKGAAAPEQDAFFMTQVDEPGESTKPEQQAAEGEGTQKKKKHKKKRSAANDDKSSSTQYYKGFEILLEDDEDVEMEVELPKDIQGNVRALKHALSHQLVYRDPSVDLDKVKRSVREFRRAPVPPAKPHKPRHERVDEVLANLRTRTTVYEESLSTVLKDTGELSKRFPEAQNMLAEIQRRYNSVRVSSMKEAAEARKIIDQAFEVLNKPKQTYKPTA